MKTLTSADADEWLKRHKIGPQDGLHTQRFAVPQAAARHLWFSRFLEQTVRPWRRCLLCVTEWGIWPSSENWHLYYRLRESCGDRRLLEDAPGHLFLQHETYDLVSFLHFCLGAGWGFWLRTPEDYSRIFVSHDEWVEVAMRDQTALEAIATELKAAKVTALAAS